MGVILLIIGLILLIAGGSWFAAAGTVGLILTIAGGVILTVEILWFIFVGFVASKGLRGN